MSLTAVGVRRTEAERVTQATRCHELQPTLNMTGEREMKWGQGAPHTAAKPSPTFASARVRDGWLDAHPLHLVNAALSYTRMR